MNARPRSALAAALALSSGCSGAADSARLAPPATPSSPPRAVPAALVDTSPVSATVAVRALVAAPAPSPPPASASSTPTRPSIAGLGPHTWIYKQPEAEGLALGRIRFGSAVPLRSTVPVKNKSCERGWYEVEPRGWVCLRTNETTLDTHDPYFEALAAQGPEKDAVWYYRYAYSSGAPMYSRVPTAAEQEKEDQAFGPRGTHQALDVWARGHEELLLDTPIAATAEVPAVFADGKRRVGGGLRDVRRLRWRTIPNGSIVAYTEAFAAAGRTWLVTPDLMLVPADRVRDMRRSTFHGVTLTPEVTLPLAWNRTKGTKPRYHREEGKLVAGEPALDAKTWVPLGEETTVEDGKRFLAVRGEPGTFVAEDDVTVSTARTAALPHGVSPGEKWIEVKILPGTLTAYEGTRPVFATLISPGKGGVPVPGQSQTKYATTAIGTFPIEWKDHVDTMSSEPREPQVMWFTDVPHIQYLRAPLAMHVAMWHEDFGNPKSAECVNVSPEDGHHLFGWTDPPLPEGWGGIRPGDGNGKSTAVVISAR